MNRISLKLLKKVQGKLGINFGSKVLVCCGEGGPSIGTIGDEGWRSRGIPTQRGRALNAKLRKKIDSMVANGFCLRCYPWPVVYLLCCVE